MKHTDGAGLKVEEFAKQITPNVNMNGLALPADEKKLLCDIIYHTREKLKVYEDQGFAEKNDGGLRLTVLFLGDSRTGKIMAAEVLANELKLDLFKVDLSAVVSKYIGETEKVLQRLFDECAALSTILFFDEADALFGKRTEVKESHDRYSNVPIDHILERIEAHQGLAILSTNMKNSKDSAFGRRIRFVVTFSSP
ncbi:MAG: ATP-binding protein [Ignavibacteriales bacterium]